MINLFNKINKQTKLLTRIMDFINKIRLWDNNSKIKTRAKTTMILTMLLSMRLTTLINNEINEW